MNDELPETPFPLPIPCPQPRIEPIKIFQLKSLKEARFEKKCQTSRNYPFSKPQSYENSPHVNNNRKTFTPATSIIFKAKRKIKDEEQKEKEKEKNPKGIPHRVINLVRTSRRSLNF